MADPASIADEGPAGEVDDGVEAVEVEAPAKTAFEPVAKKDAKDLFPMASAVEAIGEASRALVLNWPVLHTVVGEMWDGGGGSDGIVAVLIESVFFFFFFFLVSLAFDPVWILAIMLMVSIPTNVRSDIVYYFESGSEVRAKIMRW